ncbi:MAG: ABC transporter permease [Candidatus Heimdallarchaeota archaeon]|nr:ABC transporter permease [Candidatus Heimdallarchaeota archaeon]MCK4770561.1 ABC transporter permease [Candidatus Heimdallarchaeota archaeon]
MATRNRINIGNVKRRFKRIGASLRLFSKNWMGMTGIILLTIIVVLAIGGSNLTPFDPYEYSTESPTEAPSREHWLGTNRFSQDVFTILLTSLRISLLVGIVAGSLTVIIGTTVGVASAYIGGWVDTVVLRITDVILVMPALPLMLVLASLPFLGGTTHWSVIAIVYVVVFWPTSARLIRGQALSLKHRAFVTSAKSAGASPRYIIFKHILPNVFPLMLTMIITSMRQAILYESFLAYLGLGDPLNWTLGQMLHIAQVHAAFASGAWWLFFPPGIAIGLITLSFAFVGIAFDEIVNPRLRER